MQIKVWNFILVSMNDIACPGCDIHSVLDVSALQLDSTSDIGWQWGGCSDDIKFGEAVSSRFTDAGEKSRHVVSLINIHNNRLGRTVRHAVVSGNLMLTSFLF